MESSQSFTTIIDHKVRLELELSCNEYCICDLVYWESEAQGWCNLSRMEIAERMGISKQATGKLLDKLLLEGLLEKIDPKGIRTASKWNDKFDLISQPVAQVQKNDFTLVEVWTPQHKIFFHPY